MAKWGDGYRWGGGTKWGAGETGVVSDPFSGDVVWIVNIDWTGTGATNEADYLRGYDLKRGREHNIQPQGDGFEKMRPGRVTLVMDNSNGRFDPYNTESPLYPNVLPGRRIQILVYDVATKATYVRFTGHVTDIQPSSGINEVTITAEDGMRWLSDASYSSGVTYSKTTSEAVDLVLSFVNWPYQRNIQASVQPLQVFEPGNGNALDIIQDLAEANIGVFFVDRFGKACFYPLSYTTTTTHSIDQSVSLREIRIPQPWETVRNKIQVIANRRGKRPGSVIWSLAGVEAFTAGQVKAYGATFERADSIAAPLPSEDYACNTAANGSGTDLSNWFSVTVSALTATTATVTIINNTSVTGYMTRLRLVGNEIVSAPESMVSEDTTSITSYGPRKLTLNNQWLQDRAYATAYATILKDFFKTPHKDPIIQIQQRPTVQYPIDLYDKVTLTASKLGINATFTVGGLEERWLSDTGQDAVTTLYLQTVMYDTTDITPDPFYPGAVDYGSLPDIPFYDFPYWFDSWIPENNAVPITPGGGANTTNACLMTNANPTGPYPVGASNDTLRSGAVDPAGRESFIWYPCTLRAGNSINLSKVIFNGNWRDEFTYLTTNDWWNVDAIDSNKNVLISGVLAVNGADYSSRVATFSPASPVEVAGFRVWLDTNSSINGVSDSDVAASSDIGYNINFDFSSGTQNWVGADVGVNDAIPSTSSSYTFWLNGSLQVVSNGAPFQQRSWRWTPIEDITAMSTDSYIEATVTNKINAFCGAGIHWDDDSWTWVSFDNTDDFVPRTKSYIVTPANVGRKIKWFGLDWACTMTNVDYYRMFSFKVYNFGIAFIPNQKKMDIRGVAIYNVCGTGLT